MSAFRHALGFPGALVFIQCQKQPEPQRVSPVVAPAATSATATATAALTADSVAHVELVASSGPVANSEPIAGLGEWLESSLYRFRAVAIRRCPAPGPAASSPNAPLRLGITVQINAKIDSVLSSLRDITLEHDGVILEAELSPNPPCGAPLPTRQLRAAESVLGSVVFTLPDAGFAPGLALHFKPTRWGGAPGVVLALPECLADCGASKAPTTQVRIANSPSQSNTR